MPAPSDALSTAAANPPALVSPSLTLLCHLSRPRSAEEIFRIEAVERRVGVQGTQHNQHAGGSSNTPVVELPAEAPWQLNERLATAWAALATDVREGYEGRAAEEQRTYAERYRQLYVSAVTDMYHHEQQVAEHRRQARQAAASPPAQLLTNPRTAYTYFNKLHRSSVETCFPDMHFGEWSLLVSREWHSLNAEARNLYDNLRAHDWHRYQQQKLQKQHEQGVGVVEAAQDANGNGNGMGVAHASLPEPMAAAPAAIAVSADPAQTSPPDAADLGAMRSKVDRYLAKHSLHSARDKQQTAYLLYVQHQRQQLTNAAAGSSEGSTAPSAADAKLMFAELSRRCGVEWRVLPMAEKQKWYMLAALHNHQQHNAKTASATPRTSASQPSAEAPLATTVTSSSTCNNT